MADDLEYVYTPLIQRQLKAADALAKAIEATDHLGHGITDVSCSVCDALVAYEKARGMR